MITNITAAEMDGQECTAIIHDNGTVTINRAVVTRASDDPLSDIEQYSLGLVEYVNGLKSDIRKLLEIAEENTKECIRFYNKSGELDLSVIDTQSLKTIKAIEEKYK